MTPDELKAARKQLGLTQAQLADALEIPRRQTIIQWEAGTLKFRHPKILRLALKALIAGLDQN